jgi:hypothetical protein
VAAMPESRALWHKKRVEPSFLVEVEVQQQKLAASHKVHCYHEVIYKKGKTCYLPIPSRPFFSLPEQIAIVTPLEMYHSQPGKQLYKW